ncbi:transglycosylase SLT domain-containing protein [Nocardioides marmoriginsengisoli]|uniref:aggregation-promoting factor C-terminal-like domain-containing protein n=1 Tax=Nocardioides marmoriginsengisoli TaxID=661483 RepID=UPI0016156838|nr:transglycosylase SLT domain-containing protein [Nocardioides marmoriginsengisoli]
MPEKYVPKHRNAPPQRVRTGAKNAVVYSGIAVAATGLAVGVGVSAHGESPDGALVNLSAGTTQLTAADLADRQESASRSSDRSASARTVNTLKAAEVGAGNGVAVARTEDLSKSDPKALTRALMPQYGLASADFDCVDRIWTQESNWNVRADNPRSSAYGIPQALPGSKMSTAGADWRTNPETQIRWGLEYISKRYGTACSAWAFKQRRGWY